MSTKGVVYIAIGDKAKRELKQSQHSLTRSNPTLDVCVWSEQQIADYSPVQLSRYAKMTLLDWSPFEHTLYLDADTRVFRDLTPGFEILRDGFDLVIAPSSQQGSDFLWHIDDEDRAATIEALHTNEVLQLQAGVFFVARNARTKHFFNVWYNEWKRFKDQDQGALLRALQLAPLKIWLLGRLWNDNRRGKGAVIEHWFGRAR
jgi:hypothetical protein